MGNAKTWVWLALGLAGCAGTALPGLGPIKAENVCSEVKRCDARGDKALSNLRRGSEPIHLAEGQGPQSYLGKVAPKRNAKSVLKTCGGDVTRDDWFETGPAPHLVELSEAGKRELRSTLKAHLAEELLKHPELFTGPDANPEGTVEAASAGAGLSKVGLISQTYWLKDGAFERRVGQCGEEDYANIIYSLTLLRLSDLTQRELESKLSAALAAKLMPPQPAPGAGASAEETPAAEASEEPAKEGETADTGSESDAGAALADAQARRALVQELAHAAVRSLADDLRVIAAFGYDEK